MDSPLERVLSCARAEVGAREEPPGSNDGPRVRAYLRSVGLPGGYPWCAAFVAWVGERALGRRWPVPRTGDCDVLLSWGRRNNCLFFTPEVGDLFLELSPKNPRDAHHVGFVVQVGSLFLWTIEGNRGEAVCRVRRPRSHRLIFLRWSQK
jgi:hypothetical protein